MSSSDSYGMITTFKKVYYPITSRVDELICVDSLHLTTISPFQFFQVSHTTTFDLL